MLKETVDVLSARPGVLVMRHPGRHYPGILVQGDTLKELARLARSIMDTVLTDPHEAIDGAEYLTSQLEYLVSEYEQALTAHKIELPYVR